MLQLHLNEWQFHCPLRCVLYQRFDGRFCFALFCVAYVTSCRWFVSFVYSHPTGLLHWHCETTYACPHYCDIIIGTIASQITSLTIVYSAVYSGEDQRKHHSSASLAFVRGIHRGPVNSPQKWPVTQKFSIWWRHHAEHWSNPERYMQNWPVDLYTNGVQVDFASVFHVYIRVIKQNRTTCKPFV